MMCKVKSGQMSIAEILNVLMKETTTLISRICRFKYSGLLNHYWRIKVQETENEWE